MEDSYHKDRIANRRLHPETLMIGYGYAPGLSEGSLKPPIFLTSTFVFENAQQGKDFSTLPPAAVRRARARNRGSFIRASTTPTSKSLEIVSRFGIRPSVPPSSRAAWPRFQPRYSPFSGGRYHSAQSASLWRHRNAASEADGRLRRDRFSALLTASISPRCERRRRQRAREAG